MSSLRRANDGTDWKFWIVQCKWWKIKQYQKRIAKMSSIRRLTRARTISIRIIEYERLSGQLIDENGDKIE